MSVSELLEYPALVIAKYAKPFHVNYMNQRNNRRMNTQSSSESFQF